MPALLPTEPAEVSHSPHLQRQLGVAGAALLGLGSIVGTGIFVSFGLAAGSAGPAVLLAIALAALLAIFNGLSSAQLAALHPVSGGTYEYGYRWLHPCLGFLAGWMFVWAKSASAATAALGVASYAARTVGLTDSVWHVAIALAVVLVVTLGSLGGVRLSSWFNTLLVSITVGVLVVFVLTGLPLAWQHGLAPWTPFFAPGAEHAEQSPLTGLLEATALMFVAFTGYGRIATLGEEVVEPRTNIPRAIIITLILAAGLYLAVSGVAISLLGARGLATSVQQGGAPLVTAAQQLNWAVVAWLVTLGAATSMLAVLLNLQLGLSRVVLAMGRRRDLPGLFAKLNPSQTTPTAAVLLISAIMGGLVLIGNVKTTWSFSAFAVLLYYAVTNLAALQLRPEERLYPPLTAWAGLLSCLCLAFWIDPQIWLVGLGLLAVGLLWWWVARCWHGSAEQSARPS